MTNPHITGHSRRRPGLRRRRRAGVRGRRPKPVLFVLLVAVVVFAVAGVWIGSGSGSTSTAGYLALGDSLAFGYQPGSEVPHPDYHVATRFVGYPTDVARSLGLTVVNASCPGETVASMISTTAWSNGCENTNGNVGGYRTVFPLHTRYSGSQLNFAVHYLEGHRNTRLVTIDLGLNDVAVCERITLDDCGSAHEQFSLRAEIHNGLTTIYREIRTVAGYHGRLVALSYYAATPEDRGFVTELNAVTAAVAVRYGVVTADGYDTFARASTSGGGSPCRAGLLIAVPGGTCDEHPTARGQADLAAAVVRADVPAPQS